MGYHDMPDSEKISVLRRALLDADSEAVALSDAHRKLLMSLGMTPTTAALMTQEIIDNA
jgi:hypothetical protein